MLEARVHRGGLLKKIFDAIKDLVPEVNLECSSDGIQLQALDGSHAALVSLELKNEFFQTYQCSRAYCLGLNMASISKIFRLCGNDDIVTMRHADDSDTMSFVFEAAKEDRVTDFELKLMNIEQDNLTVPDAEYTATVSLSSRLYAKIVADLGQFADTLVVECTPKAVRFTSRGDIGCGNITIKPTADASPEETVTLHCTEPLAPLFAVRYLTLFSKAQPLSERVVLEMSPDHPLRVTMVLDGNEELGFIRFFLAPKIGEATQMDDDR